MYAEPGGRDLWEAERVCVRVCVWGGGGGEGVGGGGRGGAGGGRGGAGGGSHNPTTAVARCEGGYKNCSDFYLMWGSALHHHHSRLRHPF